MNEAVVEHSGWFLGECGCCRGNFLYTVEGNDPRKAGQPATAEVKTFLVGRCPLCDARIKMSCG
jgi:hypothetical protein